MPIRVPFMLYSLSAEAGTRNSPPEPAVYLVTTDDTDGARVISTDTITPGQARDLAAELIAAADRAERVGEDQWLMDRRRGVSPACDVGNHGPCRRVSQKRKDDGGPLVCNCVCHGGKG